MKKQILIVEDNELNRAILCEILSSEYDVLEADNGQMALDLLQSQADSIALILLDVMMPVMDGYAFLDRIKNDEELSLIPVIVMTQSEDEADEVVALAHGATDFVPKPYRPSVIRHRVASIIKLRETAAMINQLQYDRLTGLYSKEFFYRKVRETLDANPDGEYCIVATNIENFKLYNDIFSVEAGDKLLRECASTMKQLVGEDGICCRYGADRFLCLTTQEKEQADRRNAFPNLRLESGGSFDNIICKWGVYEITDRSILVEQMCDRALLAATSIKGQYDQFYALYDDSLRNKLLREKMITDSMRSALDEGQFVVYYQPKYSLKENRIVGAEAMVRWKHPEWGMVSPGEFIPLFEKNGFILWLDEYVWEQVCAQLHEWRAKGYPSLPVSVNISRADVYGSRLTDTLTGLIRKYNLKPADLHLEVTESAYVESAGPIISTVKELRKLGFIVEMDDFGSGYSSLNMFSQMTIDVLKLDLAFTQNETAKPVEQSILMDVITMAHRMHLTVVAEGVETRDQVERLRALHCDCVQGYYFSKPLPVAEFEALLKEQPVLGAVPIPEALDDLPPRPSLLVVDESPAYRESVRKTFESQYQILEASDAESALDCIKACKSTLAVALSMTLPQNGAVRLMSTMRQNPAYWNVPILACLPNGERASEFPMALEADDFLCKCHPIFDMVKRMQRMMDQLVTRERERALQDAANRDYATNLLNRRGLQAAIASLHRDDWPLAVCMFDLDNLKRINDVSGHTEGDRMIQNFAELLQRSTRSGDIICRYGGDEFLVILKRMSQESTVIRKSMEICTAFQDSFKDSELCVSCSAGIALCDSEETPTSVLIDHADQALYCAKRENKGGCFLWLEPQIVEITPAHSVD